ncbi:MAG: preprotein translocase subunit SecG [Lentisphaerae bacterium]|jgi:preprotein translocase subunit SecG|nr:preprotein translocase subunit SecG [Lentisphaerota bacterium]
MSLLISVLLVIEVVAAFLLVVLILAQKSKDQGLGMAFGGGMGESLFGSRAGNVLTKLTIILAVTFMVTTMLLAILFSKSATGGGSVMDRVDQGPVAPVMPMGGPGDMPVAFPEEGMDQQAVFPMDEPGAPMMMRVDESGELQPVAADEAVAVVETAAEEVAVEAEAAVAETVAEVKAVAEEIVEEAEAVAEEAAVEAEVAD